MSNITEIDIEAGITEDISGSNEQSKYIEPVSDIIEKTKISSDSSTINEPRIADEHTIFKKSNFVSNNVVISFCALAIMVNSGYLISTIIGCIKYNTFASI